MDPTTRHDEATAPPYSALRPFRDPAHVTTPTFPVYHDLVDRLLAAHATPGAGAAEYDPTVAHVLATCAGYAYSDAHTVATIMARLGLAHARCVMVAERVDAMFICSTAFLVVSECGRLGILCYRGTEPMNFINWLTDADVNPEKVPWKFPQGARVHEVHGGFYRNVRATRWAIGEKLRRALDGRSILDRAGAEPPRGPLEALYVTGHSLGAAMAAMFTVMMETNADYADVRERIRAVYTYGQPMIGDPEFAGTCDALVGKKVFRFVHGRDVVAALPPRASGAFAHFGPEWHLERAPSGAWNPPERRATRTGQVRHLYELPLAISAFFARQFQRARNLPFPYSLDDHGPQHYIAGLTPQGVRTEFGD
jgi:hypothetical protein